MYFYVVSVRPLLRVQTFELSGVRIEAIEQIAINRIQPAVDLSVIRVEGDCVETDPTVKPLWVGTKLTVRPTANDFVAPAFQLYVSQDVSFDVHLEITSGPRMLTAMIHQPGAAVESQESARAAS